jgi:hypothetical protein
MAVLPNILLVSLIFSLAFGIKSLKVLRAWSKLYR